MLAKKNDPEKNKKGGRTNWGSENISGSGDGESPRAGESYGLAESKTTGWGGVGEEKTRDSGRERVFSMQNRGRGQWVQTDNARGKQKRDVSKRGGWRGGNKQNGMNCCKVVNARSKFLVQTNSIILKADLGGAGDSGGLLV